jgi:hypothetical protein
MRPRKLVVYIVGALAFPAGAIADNRLALVGGELGNDAYYTYAGIVLPGPGNDSGRGLFQRYWVDAFGYEYDSASERIEASAYGLEAALGYGTSNDKGWASASLGLRYTDTDLTPDDTAASARGSQLGFKLDLQGERQIATGWRGNLILSLANKQRAYWTRARLMRALSSRQSLGAEFVAGGNDESRSRGVGAVFSFQPAESAWLVGLKAGYRDDSDQSGAYGGIELGYSF